MSKRFIKFPDASTNLEGLKAFFDWQTEKLDELTDDEILSRSFGVILYFNSLSNEQKASLIDRIIEYLKKLKEELDKTAKNWGVSNYSIGISAPGGVNINFTFEAAPTQVIQETTKKIEPK
jgi:hypothetical protein